MRINIPLRRLLFSLFALCTIGVGQMWGRTFSGGEILYFTNVKYNGGSDYGYAEAKLVLRTTSESNTGATFVPLTAVEGNSGYYQAIIPAGTWNYMLIFRTNANKWSDCSWAGGSYDCWNNTWQKEIDGTANLLDGAKESTSNGTWKWMIPKGATFYIDKTNIGTWGNNYYLRIGRDNHAAKYDFSGTLVPGTNMLYKCTMSENYIDYSKFVVSNNYGYTGNFNIVNIGGGSGNVAYISHQTGYVSNTTLSGLAYTFIPTGATSSGDDGQCTYHTTNNYQGKLIYTITNTEVTNATVELYYWDENNVMQVVTEGNSANVLPTTKVWCKVTPDDGYVVTKVMLSDPTEREWTDASNDASGRNLYVVRTNVSFRAVIEEYSTKTILVKDINSWTPNMYFKGWNPFLYEGYDNNNYHITTQKVADKVNVCGDDYYIVTFTNEFPFYYMHNEGESSRTAFLTPSHLTHMQKYNNNTAGDNNWGLVTTGCSDAIYWVEVTQGSNHYISNVVASTEDTLSFYAASGSTVDFHAGGNPPTNVYSSSIAPFFGSGQALEGKVGGVFTARTNGSGLTDIDVFDGDYHIHVNAKTRNYLNAGGVSKEGTTGTQFIKFDKSALFGDIYDHYWVDWFLGSGDSEGEQSVIATVGNKYNANLAGILGADEFAPKGMTQASGGNVRYAYNPETNYFARAIVSSGGDQIKIAGLAEADSVQVHNGSSYENATPSAKKSFTDASYWNYQIKAKVRGTSHANVTTTYGGGTQTLASEKKLMGGEKSTQYDVEVTYDFKTNRLIAAWTPPGTAFDGISLESNLILERTEDEESHVLNLNSDLTNISQIYTVMTFTRDHWADASRTIIVGGYTDAYYWISLPYDCNVSDIFGLNNYGSSGNWVIQTYHGDYRAEKGWWAETTSWWYNLGRDGVMKANQGYVIRLTNLASGSGPFTNMDVDEVRLYFPSAKTDLTLGRLGDATTTSVPAHPCSIWRGKDTDEHEGDPNYDRRVIDSNWNIIGSPSFNTAKITDTEWSTSIPDTTGGNYEGYTPQEPPLKPLKYFFTWAVAGIPAKGTYTVQNAQGYQFKATHAYLVQYEGTLNWAPYTNNSTDPLVGLKAPAQEKEGSDEQTLKLVLNKDEKQVDVAYISRMEEGATEDYDLNLDLSKLMSKSGNNLYTMAGYYKMAGNCLPDTVSTVPVGVQLANSGDYTFALPDGSDGTGVVLVDNVANTRTNLGLTDYTVHLDAGTIDNRFTLALSPIAEMPTGMETGESEAMRNNVRKVMIDGILYIVRGDNVFDARGARIH